MLCSRPVSYTHLFGSIAGFVMGAGVVVLISSVVGEQNFLDWGWRIPFLDVYKRQAWKST